MRLLRLALLIVASSAWPAWTLAHELDPGSTSPSAAGRRLLPPWFDTPQRDGRYLHWQQGGVRPPLDVASTVVPRARALLVV